VVEAVLDVQRLDDVAQAGGVGHPLDETAVLREAAQVGFESKI